MRTVGTDASLSLDAPTVLIVDDEPKVARLIINVFRPAGYEVLHAPDGPSGVDAVASQAPDIVLLDLNLPRLDGIQACRRIREFSDVPIIMLTSRGLEAERLRGFDVGADDYVTKPFSPAELVARVRAVLARTRRTNDRAAPVYDDGTLRVDLARRVVTLRGAPVLLSRTESRLFAALAESAERVLFHEEIKRRVWGEEYEATDEQLRTAVKSLRRKVEPEPNEPRYIIGQRGVGYLFRAPHA